MMRFGGANQTALWNAFAKTGLGSGASSNGTGDDQPTPSFASPLESNASITFNVTAPDQGNAAVPNAKIYVGDYEARVTPVATSDSSGATGAVQFVAGTYNFVAQAPGYGLFRFARTFTAGQTGTVSVAMPTNWASSSQGATVAGSTGTSTSQGNLIDDTEGTQWDDLETTPVGGQSVTVALGGGSHTVGRVQVSAMIGPGESRFSALRSFEVWACSSDCSTDAGFTKVFTSPGDAFPGIAPRPVAPDLIMRSFTLPSPVTATHLRFVVDTNQCTGGPAYAGTQDNDPSNEPTDCTAAASAVTGSGSTAADEVFSAEFEAFAPAAPPAAPDLQVTALTASTNGENLTATVSNTGNAAAGASTTQFKFDGTQVCAKATPAIAAGASTTVACKQKAPKNGTHTLVANADSTNAVAESNESNNSKTITFVKK
jgi:hypothetical protein